jgi:hypothetical protein
MGEKRWPTIVRLLSFTCVLGIVLIPAGCGPADDVPDWFGAGSLRPIASAQEAFRRNSEEDGGKQGYWRGDVAGLATMIRGGKPIALIEMSQAEADDRPDPKVSRLNQRKSHHGYWYRALRFSDETTQDSARFAVCAFPDHASVSPWTFIVDHTSTTYRKKLGNIRGIEVYPANPLIEGRERID